MSFPFQMVDVFGSGSFSGNPLAAVMLEGDPDAEEMQRLTRWFNLSETAFLLPPTHPDADYRVRIFTLEREMPFAGHPTLGSCHAWLTAGNVAKLPGKIVQECGAGLVAIRRDRTRLSFAAPPLIRSGPPSRAELDEARRFLGIEAGEIVDAAWIDNGPGWLGVRLASAEKVLSLNPARSWPVRLDIGVVGAHPPGSATAFEVRAFFSDQFGMIMEDPVTGSLNASVAQWLFETGVAKGDYVAAQGRCRGREGRVHVSRDDAGTIWVGGETRTHVAGRLQGF
ncbi:MAG: PhzF family phenazine biosynthesis protein [Rhizobiales bacterium]|nr:PhzF family phenazine biosynthesis protein [Hyphomicrobiales bacterium]